jgi:hypothetical protein
MTTLKQISVERAALLAAAGELDKLFFENATNGDLHCVNHTGVKLVNLREKKWFEKSND